MARDIIHALEYAEKWTCLIKQPALPDEQTARWIIGNRHDGFSTLDGKLRNTPFRP